MTAAARTLRALAADLRRRARDEAARGDLPAALRTRREAARYDVAAWLGEVDEAQRRGAA